MRCLVVADLHYALPQLDWLAGEAPGYDAVVIAGDLLDLASAVTRDVQILVVKKYLNRIRLRTRLMVCSGNHDPDARLDSQEQVTRWLREVREENLEVDGGLVDAGGIRFSLFPCWDGPVGRAEVEEILERGAADAVRPWVWIYHIPPDGSPVSWTGKKHGGDRDLVAWIERYKPDLVLGGHIHQSPFYDGGSWIDRLGTTWVFNPGRQPGARPTSIVLDFDSMTARWNSFEGEVERSLRDA